MMFRFFIGGFGSDHFEVLLKGTCLHVFLSLYSSRGSAYQKPDYIIEVGKDEEWIAFIAFVGTLRWKASYYTDILDGEQWELVFAHNGKEIKSCGSNAYPVGFDAFVRRLKHIVRKYDVPVGR